MRLIVISRYTFSYLFIMDGLIGFLAVDKGNVVGPNENSLLATMSTIDPIEASFSISEVQYLDFVQRTGRSPVTGNNASLIITLAPWKERTSPETQLEATVVRTRSGKCAKCKSSQEQRI